MKVFDDVIRKDVSDLPHGVYMKCANCGQLTATKRITFQDAELGDAGQINLLLCDECARLPGQMTVTNFLARRVK